MKNYNSNICVLCIGLCNDINGNCPNKNDCPYLKDEKKFERAVEAFAELLNKNSVQVNRMLQQGQIAPGDVITINIDIKKK